MKKVISIITFILIGVILFAKVDPANIKTDDTKTMYPIDELPRSAVKSQMNSLKTLTSEFYESYKTITFIVNEIAKDSCKTQDEAALRKLIDLLKKSQPENKNTVVPQEKMLGECEMVP